MTRIVYPAARIAAVTVTIPVRISAVTAVAAFNVATWELRQLARLPISPDVRRVHQQCHELAERSRQRSAEPGQAIPKPRRTATKPDLVAVEADQVAAKPDQAAAKPGG